TMADVNVNAPVDQAPIMAPPTRTDDQILPHIRWCQLDEQWFDLTKDTLRDALQITPVNNNNAFSSPSSSDALINFVNDQRKHKFHPIPDSSLHLPNEEHVFVYLKFSVKRTKREVFGMPIPGNLITADNQGSDPDSPAPKPAKATKKSKPSGKKRKLVTKTSDKPSPARKSRPGLVTKRRKPTSCLRLVDVSVDEGIPEREPRFNDEVADVQRALEDSLKSVYDAPSGPLPTMLIREPKSGKYQPLLKVQGKGKEKVTDEQVALDNEVEYDEDVPGIDTEVQKEGQAGPNPASQPLSSPVVHAVPNLKHMDLEATDVSTQPHPEQMDEGFTTTAYLKVQENLKLTIKEQVILEEPASSTGTLYSLQHLAKDIRFGDLFFNDKPSEVDNEKTTAETKAESMVCVTIQQDTFAIPPMTTPIINLTLRPDSPNVHRPLQATETETTTITIIHPPPPQPQQSTINSMLMKHISKLEHIMENLIQDNKHLEERDLPEADMKEIIHQRMWETNSYKTHEDHMMLYEALEKSMNRDHTKELLKDLAEARKKKNKRSSRASGSSQVPPPPPPPPSTNQEGLSVSSTPEDLKMDDNMAPDAQAHSSDDEDIRNAHIPKVNLQQDWLKLLEEARPATPEPAWSIPLSDVPVLKNNWASALASTFLPLPEDSLLAQTGPAFELVKVFHPNVIHLQYQMEECHKLLIDSVDDSIIRHNVSKPLPLGGPPGQVTIQSDFFFNKDLEYLRYGSKGSRPTLSISKMKAAYYPDVGLEQMVPDQMWIEEECKYDIAAMYELLGLMRILSVVGIKVFSMYGYDYIKKIIIRRADLNEHIIAERDFKYLYPSDFEDLYLLNLQGHLNHLPPKDKKILTIVVNLWTRHLVIRQRVEDFQLGIESYQTQLNLTKPRWDATGFEYKHDYTVIDSLRAVTFRDKNEVQIIMRFNEIYNFSDGILHQIDEALDYWVKEFKCKLFSRGISILLAVGTPSTGSGKLYCQWELSSSSGNALCILFPTIRTLFDYACFLTHYEKRSSFRTASAAAKPCQGDSLKLYLITGRILTVTAAGQRDVNSQPHAHTSNPLSLT
nr:hypothetical protein [Tanacetum cinerariifolium]